MPALSNGRTPGFGPGNEGSIPSRAAPYVQVYDGLQALFVEQAQQLARDPANVEAEAGLLATLAQLRMQHVHLLRRILNDHDRAGVLARLQADLP
jgi:hypothetical protein